MSGSKTDAFIRRARRNRHKPLPIVACPPGPICLALHCRFSLLADLTQSGSIAIPGFGTLAPLRNNRRITTDADVEAAADAIVGRALELGDTCALRQASRGPRTQSEVAALYRTTRQRVEQQECDAFAVLESALLSDNPNAEEWRPATPDEPTWPAPAARLRRAA